MSVAKTIKELRKNAGYNREEVAGLLNISVATLRKYEDGKSLVRLDILVSMLQIYGSDINKFLNYYKIKNTNELTKTQYVEALKMLEGGN